jgi:adenylylsulfate kinase-like enzyme
MQKGLITPTFIKKKGIKEAERMLLELIAREPHKTKTYYLLSLSRAGETDSIIKKIFRKFKNRGYVVEIVDGTKLRYRITQRGLKYLASIRG